MEKVRIGLLAANRGFFSDELAAKMRGETIRAMNAAGIEVVVPDEQMTNVGTVETYQEALTCAKLFRDKAIHGIIVAAVNFGDEQSVAVTVTETGLDVPILIFGCQEEETLTMKTPRRDSFCGLISIADALRQINAPYTVARTPICFPSDKSFTEELERFAGVCRVVNGISGARYGQLGMRPNDFWTCRYSEAALQSQLGINTITKDLSEAVLAVQKLSDCDSDVTSVLDDMAITADISAVPKDVLVKQAKFEVVLKRFVEEFDLDALAIQCWTSLQANLGTCSCSVMGRLGDQGIPCACESDVMGALSMHALRLASGNATGLADWNNVHNDDPDLVNIWHCGVFPPSLAKTKPKIGSHGILAETVGHENAWGVCEFIMREGPITIARVTQDNEANFQALVVPSKFEANKAETFGGYAWARIDGLTDLYRDVICRHFPHHTAFTAGDVADAVWEAFGNYLNFEVFGPKQTVPGMWTQVPPFRR